MIYVVEDDPDLRETIALMLKHENLESQLFASANEFLALDYHQPNSCLLLDNYMPGLSGLELQALLALRKVRIPIVFMSGDAKAPDIVTAIKGGAYQFLQKPFQKAQLISSVGEAIAEQKELDSLLAQKEQRKQKLASLTPRENQLLDLLCLGHSNKSISKELGISNSTVEFHRANLNKKLMTKTLVDLILLYRDIVTFSETTS